MHYYKVPYSVLHIQKEVKFEVEYQLLQVEEGMIL